MHNLHICNEGNTPTFRCGTRLEVIDITFTNANFSSHILNWKVDMSIDLDSDHNLITFEVGGGGGGPVAKKNSRNQEH